VYQWVNLKVAATLLGVTPAVTTRRAEQGCYGPVIQSRRHPVEKFVSTYGLSLAAKVIITKEHVERAERAVETGSLIFFPKDPWDFNDRDRLEERPLTVEEIGARVIRQRHEATPDQEYR